jgi:glycosyltransferase involved in cell wall biosynthesis
MNIGFDAKRAYHNQTGLGHYSRTLIQSLSSDFSENEYFLYNPKPSSIFNFQNKNIHEVQPRGFINKNFSSLWRSKWVVKDLIRDKIQLYHGLSHEIPRGIQKSNIPSVVTIHDLIFEHFPQQYKKIDVEIYRNKFTYACKNATHIIAISEQTKKDIIKFYKIPDEKITVCYQSCNESFSQLVSEEKKEIIKKKYSLPDTFLISVGSIIERKNLLSICKALKLIQVNVPLVVIGDGGTYKAKVKQFIQENNLTNQVIFLSENQNVKDDILFKTAADFPAIYQLATAMIYPSIAEGFGIPVLEAIMSRIPVITSNISCLPETGGDAAFYVNPMSEQEIALAIETILTNNDLVKKKIQLGILHAQKFSAKLSAQSVMSVYKTLV